MEVNDKLDTITKSLVAIESVLLGVNGVGGMVGDLKDLKDTVAVVSKDVSGISGDNKATNIEIVNIKKEQDEQGGKIKTLFISLNDNKNALTSQGTQLKVCAFIGSAVAVAIITVLVNGLMGA